MRLSVELYIGNSRLDLFDDENISLNMSIKNFQQIDKVFTDFTQSFTIPASGNNNAIMERWFDYSITTSFNPAVKIAGRIELNTIPFRRGVYRLERAVLKDGRVDYYELTFYGGTSNLAQLFGEDYLTDLNLYTYRLQYSSFSTALTTRVSSNNVLIPLIGHSKVFNYNSPASDSSSIKYATGTSNAGGLNFMDVKPAIRLKAILDAIETKYDLTFNSTFFDSTDFAKLYMWAHRESGESKNFDTSYSKFLYSSISDTSTVPPTSFTYDTTNNWFFAQDYAFSGITSVDFEVTVSLTQTGVLDASEVGYSVTAYDINNSNVEALIHLKGDATFSWTINMPEPSESDMHLIFAIKTEVPCTAGLSIRATYNLGGGSYIDITVDNAASPLSTTHGYFNFTDRSYTDSLTGESEFVQGGLPQQKVRDFLGGLVKMFNLVIEPVSTTEFNIEPLDDYYSAGTNLDLTQNIDTSEISIRPAQLYGQIEFKYSDTESILAKNFRDNNGGVGFGDLRTTIVDGDGDPISSEQFSLELPFVNMMWHRITDPNDSDTILNYLCTEAVDQNLKPLVEMPYIFYYVGQESVSTTPYGTRSKMTGTLTSRSTYNLCYQWNTKTDAYTHSLNFGSEINTYTYNDGTALTPSLYIDYWDTYITDLYALSQRRYTMKAILPIGVLHSIQMNSVIVIGMDTYRINSMQVNLTNGEATIDLFKIV